MKTLLVLGLLFFVEFSHQRSIILPSDPAENNDQINDDVFVKGLNKLRDGDIKNGVVQVKDKTIDHGRKLGDYRNPKNGIEEYFQSRKLLKSKLERKERKIEVPEIPEIKIPEIKIPEITIPEIIIPDIPEIKFDDMDFSGHKKSKNDKRGINLNPLKNVEKIIYKVVDKRGVNLKSKNSIDKILQNESDYQKLIRNERGNAGDKIEIIDVEGDPNELIDKVVEKYSDKDIRVYHVKSLEQVPDDVIEYGGDIYIEKNRPKVTRDLFVMVIL